jgi:formyltetrahydrofolate-dependent phosphoribosylglycinamide formyltransferase
MEAIARACGDGRIDGQVVLVVGNFSDSPALERAESLGLRAVTIKSPGKSGTAEDEIDYGQRLLSALQEAGVGLIVLAGYMRKLPPAVTEAYRGRIMNTHPALLPSFGGKGMYGHNVHQAVIDYGVKVSGCTVHFVDEGYDTGPIILQTTVPVKDDDTADTLSARVLKAEHESYVAAIALFAQDRLRIEGRRVRRTQLLGD